MIIFSPVIILRINVMTKIEQLEREIKTLCRMELFSLRDWFQSFLADEWDKQIEEDIAAGKLDHLARQALSDHKAGETMPL